MGTADREGPYFDQLSVGDVFDSAPSLTLTTGRAAVHQSITGIRLRLSLDEHLARTACGEQLADPALVWDIAVGQSTQVTRRVIANLFYRGLAFHRLPVIGDTLRTRTEVVGLRQNASRPSGLAALRVTTVDQEGRVVLDFWRCAMLPLSSSEVQTHYADDLSGIGESVDVSFLAEQVKSWNLSVFREPDAEARTGASWSLHTGDVVTSAPELARVTLNLAQVHHDRFAHAGERLVYGGHTIGLALAQVTRVLPDLITVAGWESCDHTGPVREGDTLISSVEVEEDKVFTEGLRLLTVHVRSSTRNDTTESPVLDWRLLAITR